MTTEAQFKQRFERWLKKRIPRQKQLTLNQRCLFIFPSRHGLYYLIVLLLVLIAAINYQNSLAYGLAFLLFSLFHTAICFTYLNVSGLRLEAGRTSEVFAGDYAEFEVRLSGRARRQYSQLHLQYPDGIRETVTVMAGETVHVPLFCKTYRRGYFEPPRLLLETFYPLGLVRCWSWIELDFNTIVYPKPVTLDPLPSMSADEGEGEIGSVSGNEDFVGFKGYQPGDVIRHVDWRAYAKGQDLQTKVFSQYQQSQSWVDWQVLSHLGEEDRLSLLCFWVLALDKERSQYGLKLPYQTFPLGDGEAHRKKLLRALALEGESHHA